MRTISWIVRNIGKPDWFLVSCAGDGGGYGITLGHIQLSITAEYVFVKDQLIVENSGPAQPKTW